MASDPGGGRLWEEAWRWPVPPPDVAARVNHRAFGLAVARELGHALPGARMVESLADLATHLAAGGAAASPDAAWVLKAPWSAAGRERLFGSGRELTDGATDGALRQRVEQLLRRWDALLFEPWMRRVADFGACGVVEGDHRVRILGLHRQAVDARGGFHGIDLTLAAPPDDGILVGLSEPERANLEETLVAVGARLAAAGYCGPFGVDAWRYLDGSGRPAFQPLGEINARMTFGLVARALAERAAPALGWPADAVVRLRLGHPKGAGRTTDLPDGAGRQIAVPLLLPVEGDHNGAWMACHPG